MPDIYEDELRVGESMSDSDESMNESEANEQTLMITRH